MGGGGIAGGGGVGGVAAEGAAGLDLGGADGAGRGDERGQVAVDLGAIAQEGVGDAGADLDVIVGDFDGGQLGQVPEGGGAFGDGDARGPLDHEVGAAGEELAAGGFIGLEAEGRGEGLGEADVDFFGDVHGRVRVISVFSARGGGRRRASRPG